MNTFQFESGKRRNVAIALALATALQPTPLPLAGIHKFYLGHHGWGLVYMILGVTQVPRIACGLEALWYVVAPHWSPFLAEAARGATSLLPLAVSPAPMSGPTPPPVPMAVTVATSLREIEQLRQEGLLSEQEFENKRRSLLAQIP